MALYVQKYGGTSVGSPDLIHNVANRIKTYHEQGHQVAVVVSAMGDSTDRLVELARRVTNRPPAREMDVLLSSGEQVTIALLAMALEKIGVPAISFLGSQVRILTDDHHTEARIESIDTERLEESIKAGKVCIVAGFQGVDARGDITTFGRGGSDTSAVALAVALKAEQCEIFTDVDGVYTTDPNKVPTARKIPKIAYDEMLELARLGAGVLHSRSVEFASKYGMTLHVRSSFNNVPGTLVVDEEDIMEKALVRGVSLKTDEDRIAVRNVPDRPGLAASLFETLASAKVNVDMIVQSTGSDGQNTISFTVPDNHLLAAKEALGRFIKEAGAGDFEVNEEIAILSAVGVGMKSHSGVAATMFQALAANDININMISTSEIKISVVVSREQGKIALKAVHEAFGLGEQPAG